MLKCWLNVDRKHNNAVMSVEISLSCVVMEYHHCTFKVKEEVLSVSKKRGELREERGENGGN